MIAADLMKIVEAVQIARGEHTGWSGDRIENRDFFLFCLGKHNPNAAAIAEEMFQNAYSFGEVLGISPEKVVQYANKISKGITGNSSVYSAYEIPQRG